MGGGDVGGGDVGGGDVGGGDVGVVMWVWWCGCGDVGGGDVGGGDVGGGCVGASDTGARGWLGVAVCVLAHKFDIYLIYLARF